MSYHLIMRIFIALEPGADFLESLAQNLLPLKKKYPHFRWVPKENLHITLAFLGETDQKVLPMIYDAVKKAAGFNEIHAAVGKLFTLPKGKAPNVLALGFSRGGEEISALACSVEKNLALTGILSDKDRKRHFLPHITLARKKTEMLFEKEDNNFMAQGIFCKMNVYESLLSRQGAQYTVLASFPLGVNKVL